MLATTASTTRRVCARRLPRHARQLSTAARQLSAAARQLSAAARQLSTADTAPPPPPPSGAAELSNRRLIFVHGPDTPQFLHGIITKHVRPESTAGLYAAFLTAHGKLLHDTFVYPTRGSTWHKQQGAEDDAGYLVEVDGEHGEALMQHLKRHKLRAKFTLRLLERGELSVWSRWREADRWTAHGQPKSDGGVIGLTDRRAPGMGERLVLAESQVRAALEHVPAASLEAYTVRRYLRGVPEGQQEMPRDDCLPMNCNIDLMGGIDFQKGCYLGQELTIRTHHTGVVRRRILPVSIFRTSQAPPTQLAYDARSDVSAGDLAGLDITPVDRPTRAAGKLVAGMGNIALAMCRLEHMTDVQVTGEGPPHPPEAAFSVRRGHGALAVKAFVPDWVRGRVRAPKPQRRVE